MFEGLTFIDFLKKGGVTVIVLGFFSVASIAVMLERAWVFRRFRRGVRDFYDKLSRTVRDDGVGAGAALCRNSTSPLARVYLSGYAKRQRGAGSGRGEISDAMELAARLEVSGLEKNLGVLGTIGSTAPFVGLFGTVLGIIRAFTDLAIAEGAVPSAVAEGIAEALVATAAGLFVAVPAVIAYNYFVRSVARESLALESLATEFIDHLSGEKHGLEPQK